MQKFKKANTFDYGQWKKDELIRNRPNMPLNTEMKMIGFRPKGQGRLIQSQTFTYGRADA